MLPGVAPSFGMVAWYQIRYMQYLRKITSADRFKLIELKLASRKTAKDCEIKNLRNDLWTPLGKPRPSHMAAQTPVLDKKSRLDKPPSGSQRALAHRKPHTRGTRLDRF
ncbi:MAG: hypothetical protein Q9175_001970 [Cornicularia normoerica]